MKVTVDTTQMGNLTKFFAEMPGKNERARKSAMSTIGYNLKKAAQDGVRTNSFGWPQISNLSRMTRKYPATRNVSARTSSYFMARDNVTGGVVKKLWGSLSALLVYSLEPAGDLLFGFSAGTYGTKKGYTRSDGTAVRVANVIGENVVTIAKKLTEGFRYVVGQGGKGDAQRRYFAALGFIFRPGTALNIPARPLVGPTYESKKADIPVWFREKFWERLKKYCG